MDRQQMIAHRNSLMDQARAMHATAKNENRGFTAEEERQHDRLMAQVETLADMIAGNLALDRISSVEPPATVLTATAVATGQRIAVPGTPQQGARGGSMAERLGTFTLADVYRGGYQAAVSGTSVASGSILLPHEVAAEVIVALEQNAVVGAAGIRVIVAEGSGSLTLPRVDERPRGTFVGPTDEIPHAEMSFGGTKLTPRKLVVLLPVANEVLRSANSSITAMLMDQVARSLATTLDDVVFEGGGVENEPRGLALRDDIVNISMGANGAVPTDLDPFVDALSQLMSRNAQPTAWVMHPQLWGVLSKLKEETTSSNVPLLGVGTDVAATGLQRRLLGLPVVLHSGLTVTEEEGSSGAKCGSVYLGQWDRVIVARWTDALMEIDGSRLFHRDMSELRAIVQVDVAVPTPTAVCRIRGVRGHLEG